MPMNRARRQLLSQRAENMRKQMTPAEKALWFRFLREYPLPFVAQKVIGEYIVDFYCRRVRLSIELDGDSHYENFEGVCEAIHTEVEKRRNDLFDQKEAFASLTRKR